jgi:hypothetical protein
MTDADLTQHRIDAKFMFYEFGNPNNSKPKADAACRRVMVNQSALLARLDAITAERDALRVAVQKAADQFGFYVTQHRAKGTPDAYAKAEVNARLRDEMEAALPAPPAGGKG